MLYTFKQCFLDCSILKPHLTIKRDLLSFTYMDECNIIHICIYVFTIRYIKKRKILRSHALLPNDHEVST